MAFLGLRISEAVKVNVSDIDFKNRMIRVYSPKTGNIDFLYLHDEIYELLENRVRTDEIMEHDGYLLHPQYCSGSKRKHVSKNCVRSHFRRYLKAAGLDDAYAIINNTGGQPGSKRQLYRLSTHSLRHYFITRVYKKTLDPMITQRLARHSSFNTTQVYINMAKNDDVNGMKKAFDENEGPKESSNLEPTELYQFIQFYEEWKKRR